MAHPTVEPTQPPGLREQRKRSTRQQLELAALRLFARDGFDATTVEAIAAEAQVSPRTFFRYFATKDEVLDAGRELRQARVREVAASVPAELSDLDAAIEVLALVAADFEAERDTMLLRRQAAVSSSALRGRMYDALHSWERMLTGVLAERRGVPLDDLAVGSAAATAITLWQHAVQRWLADSGSGLASHLRAGYAALFPS